MPGVWEMCPRSVWRELAARRKTVSPLRGTVMVLMTSGFCTPLAYQPTADWDFTMNIAARSTWWVASLTRCVSTSERFVPLSMLAIELFRVP